MGYGDDVVCYLSEADESLKKKNQEFFAELEVQGEILSPKLLNLNLQNVQLFMKLMGWKRALSVRAVIP